MRFLNREEEMERLDTLITDRVSGLAALWGRRRVGKSRLLLEWCKRHDGVYSVADLSAPTVQRRYFADAVAQKIVGFNEVEYPDWNSLFRRLSREASMVGWRGPLVMDEFPYLVIGDSSLPSILQNWVDGEREAGRMLTVIAGSSQRMMQGLVMDAAAPLYGRAAEAFALQPLAIKWMGVALGIESVIELLQSYAVWGGIPRYWELAQPYGANLAKSVDGLVLNPMGPLHTEPDRLLMEEVPAAINLRPVLDVIGGGSNRVSEIAGRMGVPVTSLSRSLRRLQELGYVIREVPFGESERSSKRSLYKISDPFLRFWFRVVAPKRGFLAGATEVARLSLWHSFQHSLTAALWEDVCRESVGIVAEKHGWGSEWSPASRWWQGSAPEWDLVSVSLDQERALVGEVKWSDKPFLPGELQRIVGALSNRPLPPGLPSRVQRLLFVSGLERGCDREIKGWHIVSAEDVLC